MSFVKKQSKNVGSKDCLVHTVGVLTEVTEDSMRLGYQAWASWVSGLCLTLVQCLRDLQKAQSVVSTSQTVGLGR